MLEQYTQNIGSFDKKNYIPVSILPLLLKFYRRVIYEQASNYLELFSATFCGIFRKPHSTEHAFFELLTSWQTSLNRCGFFCSNLLNFPKGYDCVKDLFLAKFQ